MDEYESLIRGVPLLARLPDQDLRALATLGRRSTYQREAVIFRQGDPGDALHVIIEGQIRVVYDSPAGEETTLALMGPGEACGDLSLLDGRPRSATAIAAQATKTLAVGRDDFVRWLSVRPDSALSLLETLSLLVRRKDVALADLAFVELSLRLAKRLLDLAQPASQAKAGTQKVSRIEITQAGLATMLGVTRESVNKELNRFAQQGWMELRRGSIILLDPAALWAFVRGP